MNMNNENRAEIRTLKSALNKITRDGYRAGRVIALEMRQHERAISKLDRQLGRQQFRVITVERKIEKRIAILEGRLA